MASYITTEIDNTRVSNTITDTNNFVFVPINSSWGPHEDGAFIELTSLAQLKEIFGEDAEAGTTGFEQLSSYQYAAGMLRNGFSVLAKRVVNETNSEKAYAEDTKNSAGGYDEGGALKVRINEVDFKLIVKCHNTGSGVDLKHAITSKYYGEYANNFKITCTTKFMNAANATTGTPAKVGLYFIVKNNNVTLEENLFGTLHYETTGETTVKYKLMFTPSNPVSSYIDFGSYHFCAKGYVNEEENYNIILDWSREGVPENTAYNLPFAGEYSYETGEGESASTIIVSRDGKNTTRTDAQSLVKTGFSTNGDGSFRGIADKWVYDVKFISNGGYVDEVITGEADPKDIANGMTTIAEARQDCVAFLDVPKGKETAAAVEEWSKKIEKSSYAALYSPWCKATPYGATADVWVPASYLVLSAFAKSYTSGNSICDVPAGVNRGSVNITYPQFVIGGATQEKWQRGTGEGSDLNFCINPIMNIRRYGYCIFGQRNLLELPYGTSSALQELCVRLTLNEIKKWVRDVALSLTFESNSSRTWNEFLSRTQSCLDTLVQGGYLTDYSVARNQNYDDQTNSNKLSATISVYVTRALENFDINIEVNSSDITFEETVNS